MGYDLWTLRADYFRFSVRDYRRLLKIALAYGWIPKNTKPPFPADKWEGEWSGSYFENSGQYLTPEDALELADALEAALEDIPDAQLKSSSREEVRVRITNCPPEEIERVKIKISKEMGVDPDRIVIVEDEDLLNEQTEELTLPDQKELSGLLYGFCGDMAKSHIKSFISFCRGGDGFYIW